jgi:hypothetical protein
LRRAAIKSSINIIYRLHTRYKCVKRSPLIAGRFEKLLKLFVFNFATESQSESSNKTPPLSSRHAQESGGTWQRAAWSKLQTTLEMHLEDDPRFYFLLRSPGRCQTINNL